MKRTRLKKESKQKISVIQRNLWDLCKLLIRRKYGNICYTCEAKNLIGSNWHTGHMWAKASLGAYLKYDLRVLRPQCARCNLFFGGQGAIFYKKMLDEVGQEKMNELEFDRTRSVKAYDHYIKLIELYSILYGEKN